jgi:hypothetical protein
MGKRELIDVLRADTANLSLFVRVLDVLLAEPKPEDKRYVCRDESGHFTTEQDDVCHSLTQDRRKRAKNALEGQGGRGDRKSASK